MLLLGAVLWHREFVTVDSRRMLVFIKTEAYSAVYIQSGKHSVFGNRNNGKIWHLSLFLL